MSRTFAIAAAVVAVLASAVASFELSPSWLGVAGRNTHGGGFFWRPQHPVNFDGHESVAVTVSMGPAECTESNAMLRPIGEEDEEFAKRCPVAALFTGDGGLTFERARGITAHFCGGLGALRDSKLYCPGKRVDVPAEAVKLRMERDLEADAELTKKARSPVPRPQREQPIVAFEEHEYQVVATADTEEQKAERRRKYAEGADDVHTANGVLVERKTGNLVTYDQSVFTSPIAAIRLGGGVLHIPERQVILRNAEVRLENGTVVHACYKSTDGGSHWAFTSTIPLPFSRHSMMLRVSDTRVLLIAGEVGAMNQTTSLFLGNKWEKPEKTAFVMPGTSFVSRYFTTIASGVVPRPSLGFVGLGTKKNSQKSILLSRTHNDIRDVASEQSSPDLLNYTDAFATATKFDCASDETAGAANDDASGCATSGFVSVVAADYNGTVLIFYDQLRGDRGWLPAKRRGDHVVYAMRLKVNETEEQTEYEARVLRDQKQQEANKEAEEAAKKQREELRKKREREKAEQRKRNRVRRQQWLRDDQVYRDRAAALEKEDGQHIVVRPVVEDTLDLEREMF